MSFTEETSHPERSSLNEVAPRNILLIVVTLVTFHLEMPPLNDVAPLNILAMVVTRETSHLEISAVNAPCPANNPLMSVMSDTSHDPIGPLAPLQAPDGDEARHSLTAALSSADVLGRNTTVDSVVRVDAY